MPLHSDNDEQTLTTPCQEGQHREALVSSEVLGGGVDQPLPTLLRQELLSLIPRQ